mgnify:CR=1 FL=1
MTKIEKTGSSIESVIAAFRREHNIKDWELRFDVIKKPSSGFLGLFAQKTAVLSFELPELQDRVAMFLDMLLNKMGVGFDKIKTKKEGKSIYLEVAGCKDPGFFIGKNGSMLETIQFFLNRVFEGDRRLESIYLDAEGYREKKDSQFLRPFLPMIAKVRGSGKSLTLDPMSASDRRVIHRHVEGQNGLRTLTIGEGDKKRIVIFSSKQSEKEVLSQMGVKPSKKGPDKDSDEGQEPRSSYPQRKPQSPSERKPAPRQQRHPRPAINLERAEKSAQPADAVPAEASAPRPPRRRPPRRPSESKKTQED